MVLAVHILSCCSHSNYNSNLSTQKTSDMKDTINMQKVTSRDGATIVFWYSGDYVLV